MTPELGLRLRAIDQPDRRNFHHVVGIVIDQLEPIFGDVGRGQNFVFQILGVEGNLEIDFADAFVRAAGLVIPATALRSRA